MYNICKLCELNQNLMCIHEESVAIYIDTLFIMNNQRNRLFGKSNRNKRKEINRKCQGILNYLHRNLLYCEYEYLLNINY
jgi:hypothetical protein